MVYQPVFGCGEEETIGGIEGFLEKAVDVFLEQSPAIDTGLLVSLFRHEGNL